jgi:oxygen-independent coproporphyrinogen-3 oxidase
VSLYVHVPFCDTLCWFCGCHTRPTRQYAPVAAYLRSLEEEIAMLGAALPAGVAVRQIHWGGGSPTILVPEDIARLRHALSAALDIVPDAEFSVEIDPRGLAQAQIRALLETGLTRASFGVQDFSEAVQKAINRNQSFALTRAVVDSFRLGGISSINVDVLYGLPHQTSGILMETILKVLTLEPSRIALFGYAHVPWMKKHQAMIDASALPGPVERFEQAELAAELITAWGYQRIGIDHFARADDPLAVAARAGRLHRNFQGYTDDTCDVLIGVGASAVGRLPEGYVQNAVPTGQYGRLLAEGRLPTARGITLSAEDRMRAYAIERLMCDFRLSTKELRSRYGAEAQALLAEVEELSAQDREGLVAQEGETFWVTERGRPFVRSICAALDPYFATGAARHSSAV